MSSVSTPPRPQTSNDLLDDTPGIDFGRHVQAVWRRRWLLAAVTLVCGLIGFSSSILARRTYEATLTLAASNSKIGEESSSAAVVANFRPLVESRTTAAAAVAKFGLDKPPHGYGPTLFLERALVLEEVRNSSLIRLRVRLHDPAIVADVCTFIADRAVEMARTLSQDEAVQARDLIKAQVDEASRRLGEAESRYAAYRDQAQVDLLRRDVDVLLTQRAQLSNLVVQVETEKARLARAEQELQQRERVDTVKRTIDGAPLLMEAARQEGAAPGNLLGLELRSESISPVWDKLDEQVANSRATIAALERQRSELTGARKLAGERLSQLTLLYEREAELSRLELERQLARTVYTETATRYENARLQVASRSAQLQVIDKAVPPDRPLSRNVARNTLVALMLGAGLALTLVFGVELLRSTGNNER